MQCYAEQCRPFHRRRGPRQGGVRTRFCRCRAHRRAASAQSNGARTRTQIALISYCISKLFELLLRVRHIREVNGIEDESVHNGYITFVAKAGTRHLLHKRKNTVRLKRKVSRFITQRLRQTDQMFVPKLWNQSKLPTENNSDLIPINSHQRGKRREHYCHESRKQLPVTAWTTGIRHLYESVSSEEQVHVEKSGKSQRCQIPSHSIFP